MDNTVGASPPMQTSTQDFTFCVCKILCIAFVLIGKQIFLLHFATHPRQNGRRLAQATQRLRRRCAQLATRASIWPGPGLEPRFGCESIGLWISCRYAYSTGLGEEQEKADNDTVGVDTQRPCGWASFTRHAPNLTRYRQLTCVLSCSSVSCAGSLTICFTCRFG
jgi:hypothetical protein